MTLGQRLIVMNAGRMEQIGTPEEVYARPATTFVASFIGAPPMNLLKGRARAGQPAIEIDGTTLPLTVAAPRDGDTILGVRPEHLRIGTAGWPVTVELVEMLGAERLVYGRLEGAASAALITARIDATDTAPAAGQRIHLQAAPQHLHWFDAASQQRIA